MLMSANLRMIRVITLCCLAFATCLVQAAQQRRESEQAIKHKDMDWTPPNVGAQLRSLSTDPPCSVAKVLEEAARHAVELTTNLENFTAEEKIEYEKWDHSGFPEESDASVFDYVIAFEQRGGGRASQEYRTPAKGSHAFPASGQDTGQAALALIFHPGMQVDYEMSCEGVDKWKGQFAWVIHFQQRKDRPRRTLQFRTAGGVYAAMLKGRAWISTDNGQILHLETNLMQDIPVMGLRSSAISVDYAPVEIQSRKIELWLPERVEAYWEFANYRMILFHTFSNFKLFTVETQDKVEKPRQQ
jgi:hypothetical protein